MRSVLTCRVECMFHKNQEQLWAEILYWLWNVKIWLTISAIKNFYMIVISKIYICL